MQLVDDSLLEEFRLRPCELCGRRPCEPHHVWSRGMGGGSRLDHRLNLLSLCRYCHQRVHDGGVLRSVLVCLVAQRERVTCEKVEQEMWRLQRE